MKRLEVSIFKNQFILIVLSLFAVFLSTCSPPEALPFTPEITFNDLIFKDLNGEPDSLILFIDFKDGDGDLGLETSDTYFPYHDFEAIRGSNGKYVTLSSVNNSFPWVKTIPNFTQAIGEYSNSDTRMEFNCANYEIGYINPDTTIFSSDSRIFGNNNSSVIFYTSLSIDPRDIDTTTLVLDTVLVNRNVNRYNIFVDYYIEKNGKFEFFDWLTAFDDTGCLGLDFNGRFPVFDRKNLETGSTLVGTLKYAMVSSGFSILFRTGAIKLEVTIQDRHLNKSNTIVVGGDNGFTLQEVARE